MSSKDSIYSHEKDKVLEQEFVRFKYQALDSLNNNITKTSGQLKQYKTTSVTLVIVCFILLLAVLILFKKRTARFKQTEADGNAATVQSEEVERLQQMINRLAGRNEQLERKLQVQGVGDISALRELIASNKLHTDGYWNEFLLMFSKVYPDFFERLKEKYPLLTQNELRICSLIKLNLGVLDMSNALQITTEGARKARYRLYKKMELSSDQELTDMILRF
jgi:DNA-binding CsgD family transcriptional regulator